MDLLKLYSILQGVVITIIFSYFTGKGDFDWTRKEDIITLLGLLGWTFPYIGRIWGWW